MTDVKSGFALVAAVLIVAPLASGLVDRSPLSFAFLFLGLGLLIGEGGIDLMSFGTDSSLLEIPATITLSLVLFLGAVKFQVDQLRRRWLIPVLILGPGTALVIVLGAFASAGCWASPSPLPCWREPSWHPQTRSSSGRYCGTSEYHDPSGGYCGSRPG